MLEVNGQAWSDTRPIYFYHSLSPSAISVTGNNTTFSPQNTGLDISCTVDTSRYYNWTYSATKGGVDYNWPYVPDAATISYPEPAISTNTSFGSMGTGTTTQTYSLSSNYATIFGNSSDASWDAEFIDRNFVVTRTQSNKVYNRNPSTGYDTRSAVGGIDVWDYAAGTAKPRVDPAYTTTNTSTKTTNFPLRLQLKPTKVMSDNDFYVWDTNNNNIKAYIQANGINTSQYPNITLQWTYPYNEIAAGLISGYLLQFYTDAACTQLNTSIDYSTNNYNNVTYTINTQSVLVLGIDNYVKITPYYKYGNNYYYSNNPLIEYLGFAIAKPDAPVINFPITGTTWHNRQFRILATLPNYLTIQGDSGAFEDIQVSINNIIYSFTSNPEIFSTSTIAYNKKIIINPSLISTFTNEASYTIKLRVTKMSSIGLWSDWSNEVILYREDLAPIEAGGEDYPLIYDELNQILGESDSYSSPGDTNINIYNELNGIVGESDPYTGGTTQGDIVVGRIILASHFNTIRDYSIRLYNVYPIVNLDSDNIAAVIGEKILHSNYLGMYRTILNIQSSVNSWATFDNNRQSVKFNETIDLLDNPNQPIRGEIITADRDLRPGSGRDYLLALYDCMNLLK